MDIKIIFTFLWNALGNGNKAYSTECSLCSCFLGESG